jgi:hypothetical protein
VEFEVTSFYFVTPILIATYVRTVLQNIPSETVFLNYLSSFEILLLTAIQLCRLARFWRGHRNKEFQPTEPHLGALSRLRLRLAFSFQFWNITDLIAFLVFCCNYSLIAILVNTLYSSHMASANEVFTACGRVKSFANLSSDWNVALLLGGISVLLLTGMYVGLLAIVVMAINLPYRVHFPPGSKWDFTRPSQFSRLGLMFWFFLFHSVLALILLNGMAATRGHLRGAAGEDFDDDEWGFGQVLAIFVWVPITLKIIRLLWREYARIVWTFLKKVVKDALRGAGRMTSKSLVYIFVCFTPRR